MRLALLGVCFLVAFQSGWAQANEHQTNFQLWLDPTINYNLSAKTRISGDLYYRTRLNDTGWVQNVVRPGIAHSFSPAFAVMGGAALFRVKDHEAAARNEIRYWAGVQYSHPAPWKISVQHYLRAEERVFYQKGFETFTSLRLRYRLGLSYQVWDRPDSDKSSQVVAQYEPFMSITEGKLGDQVFSTERLTFGLSNTLTAKLRFDVYYMLQWGRRIKEDHFEFTDHIVQLKLQYTINPV